MIILDTDVISELTRPVPDPDVVSWLDSLPTEDTAITAITAAELLYGVRRLPDGRRKVELAEAIHALINADFRDRVEPFDLDHEAPAAHLEPGGCFVIEVEVPAGRRRRNAADTLAQEMSPVADECALVQPPLEFIVQFRNRR